MRTFIGRRDEDLIELLIPFTIITSRHSNDSWWVKYTKMLDKKRYGVATYNGFLRLRHNIKTSWRMYKRVVMPSKAPTNGMIGWLSSFLVSSSFPSFTAIPVNPQHSAKKKTRITFSNFVSKFDGSEFSRCTYLTTVSANISRIYPTMSTLRRTKPRRKLLKLTGKLNYSSVHPYVHRK